MNPSTNLVNVFLRSCLFFSLTVLLAWYLEWDIVDVSWSIWVATFAASIISVFVEAIFFYWLLEHAEVTEEQKASPHYNPSTTEGNIASVLFMFCILFYLVYMVNFVVGLTLNDVLPLFNQGSGIEMSQLTFHAFATYWPFLLISLINPCLFYYQIFKQKKYQNDDCLLYTSPSPRDQRGSRMPSSA